MFWGLVNGVKSILHKTNKYNCNCDKTKKVVEVVNDISNEEIALEVKDDKKDEKEEHTKTVVSSNTYKSSTTVTGTTKPSSVNISQPLKVVLIVTGSPFLRCSAHSTLDETKLSSLLYCANAIVMFKVLLSSS